MVREIILGSVTLSVVSPAYSIKLIGTVFIGAMTLNNT
jgi:hypothetical protein